MGNENAFYYFEKRSGTPKRIKEFPGVPVYSTRMFFAPVGSVSDLDWRRFDRQTTGIKSIASSRNGDGHAAIRAERLRALLARAELERMITAPGAFDGIFARFLELSSFAAIYMTGAGTSLSSSYPTFAL